MGSYGRRTIYEQIEEERRGQVRHDRTDDERSRMQWGILLKDHISRAIRASDSGDRDEWRQRLIVTAALCVAAIETSDRRRSHEDIDQTGPVMNFIDELIENEPTDPQIMPIPHPPKKPDPEHEPDPDPTLQ